MNGKFASCKSLKQLISVKTDEAVRWREQNAKVKLVYCFGSTRLVKYEKGEAVKVRALNQDNPEISDTNCWENHFRTKKEEVWIDCVLQILSCCPNKGCGLRHKAVTRGKIVTSRNDSNEFHWRTFRHWSSSLVPFYISSRNETDPFYLLTNSSQNLFLLFLFLLMLCAVINKI